MDLTSKGSVSVTTNCAFITCELHIRLASMSSGLPVCANSYNHRLAPPCPFVQIHMGKGFAWMSIRSLCVQGCESLCSAEASTDKDKSGMTLHRHAAVPTVSASFSCQCRFVRGLADTDACGSLLFLLFAQTASMTVTQSLSFVRTTAGMDSCDVMANVM